MKYTKFFRKYYILTIVIVSFIVSSVVGGVFGYYSATVFSDQNSFPSLIKQIINPDTNGQTQKYSDEQSRVIEVVKNSSLAVVSLVATKDVTIVEQNGVNPFQNFCNDPFFRQFLGSQCDTPQKTPSSKVETQQVAAGTGFFISSDGTILTNKHVVNITGTDITAITSDGEKYPAKIIAKDPVQDLAILKITGSNFASLPLADSSKIQIGQTVIAIGNALGQFSNTVSKGVISGLSRSIVASDGGSSSEKLDQVIQTDAAINPGNSGGPLLDLSGEIIGINTAVAQGAQNIGFAIPINQAKRDIEQVKKTGKISYPFLGIRYMLIDDALKQKNNLPVNYGALIVKGATQSDMAVTPGSPAAKAGIMEDDIILEIDGKKINQDNDLAKLLQAHNVGDTIKLKILSQGVEKNVSVVLSERTQ